MQSKCLFKHFSLSHNRHIYCLITLWFAGILTGILLSIDRYSASEAILHSAFAVKPSPIFVLLSVSLPLASVIVSIATQWVPLQYITVVFTAVCHGFCGNLVNLMTGSSAWLLRPMLLFSASCSSVLMWWLLLCNINRRPSNLHRTVCLLVALVAVVVSVDILGISPLLIHLSKYF